MNRWVQGARPRTLPAAVVPVALGAASVVGEPASAWWRVSLALLVSLALQVAVNYANDYSDGVRGTDDQRVGPVRLVASGLATPGAVKRAAVIAFAVAAVAGLALALATSLWLLAVGAAAIAAGWFYTGGPRPYGYLGLGEVFVFVFFGLVATAGTAYVIGGSITAVGWLAGCMAGCLACALLVVNNLRDIPTDREVGKRTLAVRIGDRWTRRLYSGLMAASFALVMAIAVTGRPLAAIGLLGIAAAWPAIGKVLDGASGAALVAVLGATGRAQMLTGLLAAVGIAASG
ncbi:MAG: 1,4-dihydroxy-2-naphthoate polyprenyltransferase [Ilumatobacteraceae bacterium]